MTVVDTAVAQLQELRRVFLHHVDGLTDEEFLWEPVDGCWSVRKRDDEWVFEVVKPDPDPAPLTTIAWLIAHMTQHLFTAERALRDQPIDSRPPTFGTASEAIAHWTSRVDGIAAALDDSSDEALARTTHCRAAAEPSNVGVLVWRVIFETIYHGAEVSRMRHLYANRSTFRPSP